MHVEVIEGVDEGGGTTCVPSGATTGTSAPNVCVMAVWQEQWERVHRMLYRVESAYSGDSPGGIERVKDDVYAFFQSIHHLKDWLRNDPQSGVTKADGDTLIDNSNELRVCADLCNGSKHLKFNRPPRTGDPSTSITKVSTELQSSGQTIVLGGGGGPPQIIVASPAKTARQIEVSSGGAQYDVLDLAREGVRQWKVFLEAKGLL
jgi:hypothetical protein